MTTAFQVDGVLYTMQHSALGDNRMRVPQLKMLLQRQRRASEPALPKKPRPLGGPAGMSLSPWREWLKEDEHLYGYRKVDTYVYKNSSKNREGS